MKSYNLSTLAVVCLLAVALAGCRSPYRADQGALFGGLLGAGTGAIIGNASGNAGAGAAIGAGLGAITGAAVGSELDHIEAQNRAMIAQQMGRQVSADAVTLGDVVDMTKAGVDDELIANHVRAHGVAAPLQAADLIYLQQQGVSTKVTKAMQEPPRRQARPVVIHERTPPVIVQEYHYGPPAWGHGCDPPVYHHRRHGHRSGVHWGVSVGG